MNRKSIKAALKIQQSIEGFTPETSLLLKVIDLAQYSSEWQSLTTVKHHSYGKMSYETHRFYYPSELLLKLQNLFS